MTVRHQVPSRIRPACAEPTAVQSIDQAPLRSAPKKNRRTKAYAVAAVRPWRPPARPWPAFAPARSRARRRRAVREPPRRQARRRKARPVRIPSRGPLHHRGSTPGGDWAAAEMGSVRRNVCHARVTAYPARPIRLRLGGRRHMIPRIDATGSCGYDSGMVERVISGGQTGADQAGLAVAKRLAFPRAATCRRAG